MNPLRRLRAPLLAFVMFLPLLTVSCTGGDDTVEEPPFDTGDETSADASDAGKSDSRADASDATDAGADTGIDASSETIVPDADATSDAPDGETDATDATDATDGGPDATDGGPDATDATDDGDTAIDDGVDSGSDAADAADVADAADAADVADAADADADATDVGCTGPSDCTGVAHTSCQDVTCNVPTGTCVVVPKSDTTLCNDGNACTTVDSCVSGVCTGSSPVVCTASDACHSVGACNTTTGVCTNPAKSDGDACDDGNACTTGTTCTTGVCGGGSSTTTCAPIDACHNAGTCNATTGACNPGTAKADATPCDDGNACTSSTTCTLGVCGGGTTTTCGAGDACHDPGVCNTSTGVCSNPAKADTTACDDSNACTSGTTCTSGTCGGGATTICAAPDGCHDVGVCSPSTGVCSNPAKANGTSCNDGDLCLTGDTCQSGTCSPGTTAVTCGPASDQCHVAGTCVPLTGACTNPAKSDGATCNDGNTCTTVDTCLTGACVGGSPTVCTASDACHLAGTCTSGTGCSNPVAGYGGVCGGATAGTVCDGAGACSLLEFVVVRVGTGTGALSNASTATFVERRKLDGTLVATATIDSTAFTLGGTATTEGTLSLTTDGKFVMLGGYAVATGTATPSGTSTTGATPILRAIGRVDATNAFDFAALPSTAFTGQAIRGVTSTDGSLIWAAGGNGTRYWVRGAPTDASVVTTNMRALGIYAGQLFGSSGSGGLETVTIGTGLPITTTTSTALPGMPLSTVPAPGPSPHGFALLDMNANNFAATGMDTLYVADDRTVAQGGGVQKWTYSDTTSTWTLSATYATTGTFGMLNVTALKVGTVVYLIATTNETNNKIVTFIDDGLSSPTAATVVPVTTNLAYRGVAPAPR